ncbi:hypothetical protein D3C71_1829580 [compost metagenome]
MSSAAAVSSATGSGACTSSRMAWGRVAGSTGKLPGNGGTSRGEPGPVTGAAGEGGSGGGTAGTGGGILGSDMVSMRLVSYSPSALALSLS